MRHFPVPLALLFVVGCAATPRPVATPGTPPAPAQARGDLVGLDAAALAARFGAPRLRVLEGSGLKLQFAGESCLIDAYLYPPANGGTARVVHVDARDREGRSVDQAACIAAVGTR